MKVFANDGGNGTKNDWVVGDSEREHVLVCPMWKCLARILCASIRFDVVNSLHFPLKEIAVVARHVCRDKFIGGDRPTHRSTSGSLGLTQTHSAHTLF